MPASIRRNTFDEAANITKVVFQTGRFVQEYELNEMQDDIRVPGYRNAMFLAKNSSGFRTSTGYTGVGGVNQISLTIPDFVVNGFPVKSPGTLVVTGLTTPGTPTRTDYAYLEATQSESADPNPDPVEGVKSFRNALVVTLKVVEGAAVPASTGDVWSGGTFRMPVAVINRTNSATITNNMIVRQYDLLPGQICDEVTTITNGAVARIHPGTECIIEAQTANEPMHFIDQVITDTSIALSDDGVIDSTDAGKKLLGPYGVGDSFSILRTLNGRAVVSVGDGVNSFGDFNGVDALETVLTSFWSDFPGKAITVCMKPGNYARTSGVSLRILGPCTIVGIGGIGAGIYPILVGSTDPIIDATSVANQYPLHIEKIYIQNGPGGGDSKVAITVTDREFTLRDCIVEGSVVMIDMDSNFERPPSTIDHCKIYGKDTAPAVVIRAPSGNEFDAVVIRDSVISADGRLTSCIQVDPNGSATSVTLKSISVEGCTLVAGAQPSYTGTYRETGILSINDTSTAIASIGKISFRRCTMKTKTRAGSPASYLFRMLIGTSVTGGVSNNTFVREFSFEECSFSLDVTTAGTGFSWFKIKVRDYSGGGGSEDNQMQLSFNRCIFDLGNRQVGFDTDDNVVNGYRAPIILHGNRISLKDNRIRGIVANLWDATAYTGAASSVLDLTPTDKFDAAGDHASSLVIDGLAIEKLTLGAGGTKPNYVIRFLSDADSVVDISKVTYSQTSLAGPLTQVAGAIIYGDLTGPAGHQGGHVCVRNCKLVSQTGAGRESNGIMLYSSGVVLEQSRTVVECTVVGFGQCGIRLTNTASGGTGITRMTVRDCTVRNCGTEGILVSSSTPPVSTTFAHVTGCLASQCTGIGIRILEVPQGCIQNCYAHDNNTAAGTPYQISIESTVTTYTKSVYGNTCVIAGVIANLRITNGNVAGNQPHLIGVEASNAAPAFGTRTAGENMRFNYAVLQV